MAFEFIKRFSLFLMAGGGCYILGLVILWFGVSVFDLNYLVVMVFAFLIINPIGFIINRAYAFKDGQVDLGLSITKYSIMALAGLFVSLFLVWLMVEFFRINYMVSNILATMLLLLGNFTIHYFWTFKI